MALIPTKKEQLSMRLKRLQLNHFPAFRRTGGRLTYIAQDWKEIRVRLKLNRKTRNYVGSVFGGSIYGAADPIYMFQLIQILGEDYVVWDKAATIRFLRPVRVPVIAQFVISDNLIRTIKNQVRLKNKYTFTLKTTFRDGNGIKYAEVEKELYVADKIYYRQMKKLAATQPFDAR